MDRLARYEEVAQYINRRRLMYCGNNGDAVL